MKIVNANTNKTCSVIFFFPNKQKVIKAIKYNIAKMLK